MFGSDKGLLLFFLNNSRFVYSLRLERPLLHALSGFLAMYRRRLERRLFVSQIDAHLQLFGRFAWPLGILRVWDDKMLIAFYSFPKNGIYAWRDKSVEIPIDPFIVIIYWWIFFLMISQRHWWCVFPIEERMWLMGAMYMPNWLQKKLTYEISKKTNFTVWYQVHHGLLCVVNARVVDDRVVDGLTVFHYFYEAHFVHKNVIYRTMLSPYWPIFLIALFIRDILCAANDRYTWRWLQ